MSSPQRPTPDDLERAMHRAMSLAGRGPTTGVNPQVGCVLLRADGSTAAEGWHRGAGTPHAEVEALSSLRESPEGLTAVVTLEPCNHQGRTGPCSAALIAAGVAQVAYGVADPGGRSGGGAERLRAAGILVEGGVLENEVTENLRRWLSAERTGRPFVTVKWASSLDGRAAASDGSSRWITGTAARQHVHEQRAAHDAILVGTGTILADDPSLTARGDGGELLGDQPYPVIVGLRPIPADAAIRRHPRGFFETRSRDLEGVLRELYRREIRSVFVEGGPTVATEIIRSGLADDYLVYLAPTLLGGERLAIGDIGIDTIDQQRRLHVIRATPLGEDLAIVARDQSRSSL